jgi:hypothetical protein
LDEYQDWQVYRQQRQSNEEETLLSPLDGSQALAYPRPKKLQ